MEPKNSNNPFHKPITVYWTPGSEQEMDAETRAWLEHFVAAFYAEQDQFCWESQPDLEGELAELARLDSQVQGDECPQALEWIMNAHRKHGG